MWVEGRQLIDNLLSCEKPIVSVVNGYAMGLGANYALLADVVFATPTAIFADTHVRVGMGAGDGGQLIWPLLMGVNRAKYFMMTGERVNAHQALELGLVNFVCDADQALDEALALADRLASGPQMAIRASKVGINAYMRLVASIVMPVSMRAEELCMHSPDREESRAALRENREPRFE